MNLINNLVRNDIGFLLRSFHLQVEVTSSYTYLFSYLYW